MVHYAGEPFPITGEIKLEIEKFPREILDKMMAAHMQGGLPRIEVRIPQLYIQGGATLTSDTDRTTLEFEFVALDIEIKES